MPRKKKVNFDKLIAAVESDQPSKDIMAKFGIRTLAQLKSLYLDALTEKGVVPAIVSTRRTKAAPPQKSKELKVNKRGSMIVSREMIEEMGYRIGDMFSVRKTAAGVSLKKLTSE